MKFSNNSTRTILPSILLIWAIINCSSCSGPATSFSPRDSLLQNKNAHTLAGKLYFFAPEFDSTHLVATGACDCCSDNIIFLDDSSFLDMDYCEDGTTYVRGKYKMDDHLLRLDFDSVEVEKYFPETDDRTGTRAERSIYRTRIHRHDTKTYNIREYRGMKIFAHNDFGALDTGRHYNELMRGIHEEGIWDRLNTNPSLVPRNSPDIEVYLMGVWASPGESNANFEIRDDSIYYVDRGKMYPYALKNDSIRITYDGFEFVSPVKILRTDTLVFEGRDRQVFYRFRK